MTNDIIAKKDDTTNRRTMACECGSIQFAVGIFRGINDLITLSCLECNAVKSQTFDEIIDQ
jgi:hypothetical protein